MKSSGKNEDAKAIDGLITKARKLMGPPVIEFDDEAHWDGGILFFWASRGKDRIRCVAGRETIAELPGFTHATSQEIGTRKAEIHEVLRPTAVWKIEAGHFSEPDHKTVTIYVSDVLTA